MQSSVPAVRAVLFAVALLAWAPAQATKCVMTKWSTWSTCTAACDCGLKQRTREVKVQPTADPSLLSLSTLLSQNKDSLQRLDGSYDGAGYTRLQQRVTALNKLNMDGSTKAALLALGIGESDGAGTEWPKLLGAVKDVGGVPKLLGMSGAQLQELDYDAIVSSREIGQLKDIVALEHVPLTTILEKLGLEVIDADAVRHLSMPKPCPFDSEAVTCNCNTCNSATMPPKLAGTAKAAKIAVPKIASSAHGFTPSKFKPAGGFPSDFGEQGACVLDKGEAVLELLVAMNQCSAWQGEVGTLCYKESISHLYKHTEMCCEVSVPTLALGLFRSYILRDALPTTRNLTNSRAHSRTRTPHPSLHPGPRTFCPLGIRPCVREGYCPLPAPFEVLQMRSR